MTPKEKSTPIDAAVLAAKLEKALDDIRFAFGNGWVWPANAATQIDEVVAALESDSTSTKADVEALIEKLAALEHEQWVTWASHIINGEPGLTKDRVFRWRQLLVPYSRLTEQEKEQDRVWARKVLAAINSKEKQDA